MSLPTINLDDRHFQDIVDEAKKRIGQQYPDWSDHNVSDPGIMLVELFAWMTEMVLYRLNQVPQQSAVTFLDKMLGIKQRGALPATADVTFWLTKPHPHLVTIPAGTEVASTRTAQEESVVFFTVSDAEIFPPHLERAYNYESNSPNPYKPINLDPLNEGKEIFGVFRKPRANCNTGDALYLGFATDVSRHILEIRMSTKGGAGYLETYSPIEWQTYSPVDKKWVACEIADDTIKFKGTGGRVRMHIPFNLAKGLDPEGNRNVEQANELYWVRARLKELSAAEKEITNRTSPQLIRLEAHTWGITTPATHGHTIKSELLGVSDGTAGQRFYLKHTSVLPRGTGEVLISQLGEETPQVWQEVPSFANKTADDKVYLLDEVTGEIRFAPALRQPDGAFKQYGAIPPYGAKLLFSQYRYGGGVSGNIPAEKLETLKTAIPSIGHVHNRKPASGGQNAENLETAVMRGLQEMRMGMRMTAITAQDFEFLAFQLLREAGISARVKCLTPNRTQSGMLAVRLLIIKNSSKDDKPASSADLKLSTQEQQQLRFQLKGKTLITTEVVIERFILYQVSLDIELLPSATTKPAEVEKRLYHFLNPVEPYNHLTTNLPIRQELHISDIHRLLYDIPVKTVRMFEGNNIKDNNKEIPQLTVPETGIIVSGTHGVTFANQ